VEMVPESQKTRLKFWEGRTQGQKKGVLPKASSRFGVAERESQQYCVKPSSLEALNVGGEERTSSHG